MAHIRLHKEDGDWIEVRGTALKIPGVDRYRIIITTDLDIFATNALAHLEVRINDMPARALGWVLPPEKSRARGYVSFEASLDVMEQG